MASFRWISDRALVLLGLRRKKEEATERVIVANDPASCVPNNVSNCISTRKYNWWTFLPISLLYQFRMASNCYFLMLVVLVLIPGLAPVSAFSTIFPLCLILTVSEIREFIEEYQAGSRDKRTNTALVNLLAGKRVESASLRPGDIVLLKRDERVPADILILQTANSDGSVCIETSSLDGETNLKVRKCPSIISSLTLGSLTSENFTITCEQPHVDMYSFGGHVYRSKTGDTQSISLDNVVWRGCTIRNTEWMTGVVIYAGQDCKVMLNARSGIKPSKVTSIDRQMNRNVLGIFILQIIICAIFASVGSSNFSDMIGAVTNPWYMLGYAEQSWFALFFAFFVLLSFFIPVSLWVSLEMLRLLQALMIERDPTGIKCNAKNIHEELGQITHIFTDKTGTLTVNRMKFVGIAVPGQLYHLQQEESDSSEMKLSFPGVTSPNPQLIQLLSQVLAENPLGPERTLFEALSLCHSCERVVEPITGRLSNQSSTPDEAALVSAAAEVGYMFSARPKPNIISVEISHEGKIKQYDLLHVIPFTSSRRMMSVVVRSRDSDTIEVLSKGADSSIIPKCIGDVEGVKVSVSNFAYHGYRTLCVARRVVSHSQWKDWSDRLMTDGETVDSEIESDFDIVGVTALEDRLQDDVPETLRAMRAAGIKVCMITGDKRETAINIAKACGLISSRKDVYVMLTDRSGEDGQRAVSSSQPVVGGGSFVPLQMLEDVARTSWPKEYWLSEVANLGGVVSSSLAPPGLIRNESRESTTEERLARRNFSLVIDGKGLQSIFASEKTTQQLVDVLTFDQCESVVFCRVSPKQKGEIVRTVQHYLENSKSQSTRKKRWSTLAIGDGANDVNMINIANVGVGISGNEGAQAANSADYAVNQFRDLYRLLLVHGRWNYRRTKDFIFVFIYKNFVCAMCLFWYATVSSFSAATLFESTYLLLFNSVFGIVPMFVFGAIDKDIDPVADCPPQSWQPVTVTKQYWREMVVPRLYKTAEKFSSKNLIKWCFLGIFHSVAPFYFTWACWEYETGAIASNGQVASLWMSSLLVYTAEIFLISIVTMYVSASWTKLLVWSTLVCNLAAYFLFVVVYDYIKLPVGSHPVLGIAPSTLGNPGFWIILTLTLVVSTAPVFWFKKGIQFRKSYQPCYADAIMNTKAQHQLNKGARYSVSPVSNYTV